MKYKAVYVKPHQYALASKEADKVRSQYSEEETPRWYPGQRWRLISDEDYVSLSKSFLGYGPMVSGTASYKFDHDNKVVVLELDGTQGFTPLNALVGEEPFQVLEHTREEGTPTDLPWWASWWGDEEGWVY